MSDAYYTRRLKQTGNEIEFHFFESEVLAHYREHPEYDVCSSHLYGNGSMIQNIYWGRTVHNVPCLAVLLAHLCGLSPKDQERWKLSEVNDSHHPKVDARYRGQIFDGDWPSRITSFEAIFLYARELNSLFADRGTKLLPHVPTSNIEPDFLAPLAYNTRRALCQFAQDLDTFLQPNLTLLESRITNEDRKKEASVARSKGQSRNLLKMYFEEGGSLTRAIEHGLDALWQLSQLRQKSAHTLVPAHGGEDFRAVQSDLAFRVQAGLKAMLEGAITAESAADDGYRNFVLSLDVEQPESHSTVSDG